eukprot:5963561-Prymnesium_polylepis.1
MKRDELIPRAMVGGNSRREALARTMALCLLSLFSPLGAQPTMKFTEGNSTKFGAAGSRRELRRDEDFRLV